MKISTDPSPVASRRQHDPKEKLINSDSSRKLPLTPKAVGNLWQKSS